MLSDDLSPPSESNNTVVEVTDIPNETDLKVDEVETDAPDAAQAVDENSEESSHDLTTILKANSDLTRAEEPIADCPPSYQEVLQSSVRLGVHKLKDDLEHAFVGLENIHKEKVELEQTFVGLENGNIPIETPIPLFRSYSDIESLNSSEFSCMTVESAEDVVVDEEPVDLVENLSMCDIAQSSTETPSVDHVRTASEPVCSPAGLPEEICPTYPILYNSKSLIFLGT